MIARLIPLACELILIARLHTISFAFAARGRWPAIRNEYRRIRFERTNIHFIRPHPNSPMELLNYSLTNRGTPKTLL